MRGCLRGLFEQQKSFDRKTMYRLIQLKKLCKLVLIRDNLQQKADKNRYIQNKNFFILRIGYLCNPLIEFFDVLEMSIVNKKRKPLHKNVNKRKEKAREHLIMTKFLFDRR